MTTACVAVNTSRVVHELVEGEVIIICLETGNYYQLTGLGVTAWTLIEQTPTRTQLQSALSQACAAGEDDLETRLSTFINELVAEQIVVTGDGGNAPKTLQIDPTAQPLPLNTLVLSKFTNMSDLLLLDPIHDVDEQGWPHAHER